MTYLGRGTENEVPLHLVTFCMSTSQYKHDFKNFMKTMAFPTRWHWSSKSSSNYVIILKCCIYMHFRAVCTLLVTAFVWHRYVVQKCISCLFSLLIYYSSWLISYTLNLYLECRDGIYVLSKWVNELVTWAQAEIPTTYLGTLRHVDIALTIPSIVTCAERNCRIVGKTVLATKIPLWKFSRQMCRRKIYSESILQDVSLR